MVKYCLYVSWCFLEINSNTFSNVCFFVTIQLQAERDVLEMVKRVERSISNLSQCTTCPVPADVLDGLGEIIEVGAAVPLSFSVINTDHLVTFVVITTNHLVPLSPLGVIATNHVVKLVRYLFFAGKRG